MNNAARNIPLRGITEPLRVVDLAATAEVLARHDILPGYGGGLAGCRCQLWTGPIADHYGHVAETLRDAGLLRGGAC